MPGKKMKHPIKSQAQRGFFGAEMGRASKGLATDSGMSKAVLAEHLHASKGKKLPKHVKHS